ncbi:hypothetical protein N656DRAFT_675931, partial [Canariomyces notabilis]
VSSVGTLDIFPPEILLMILDVLDVQSIARLSMACFRARTVVWSMLAYRDLIEFALPTMVALVRTGMASYHSITQLHGALRSEQCCTCSEYGPFLFLPTCSRCCYTCLQFRPCFLMLEPEEVENYFALSRYQVDKLPMFWVVPEFYDPNHSGLLRKQDYTLVNVLAARELSVEVHGSLGKTHVRPLHDTDHFRYHAVGRFLLSQPLAPYDDDCIEDVYFEEPDEFFGRAVMEFPSLSKTGELDEGLWCLGCEPTKLPIDPPPPVNAKSRPWDRAWSTVSFLEHVKRCPGARELL